MRIDSHHHIWDLNVRPQTWMKGDELKPISQQKGDWKAALMTCIMKSHSKDTLYWQQRLGSRYGTYSPEVEFWWSPKTDLSTMEKLATELVDS